MRIVHISDIHIRNLKYHDDYRRVFENLYRKIEELKPDVVVNTGDTAHTKTQISPEFVEMASEHIRRVAALTDYHIILGNHDLNLMNSDRQDAVTPIVESIRDSRVHLHKKSGPVIIPRCDPAVTFWVFGIGDQENYPTPDQWEGLNDQRVNIGLFHGSIKNCLTDSNWRMTHTERELTIFDGLDYVLMGDIHKQQFMDSQQRIGYAGSLVQQNFGEEVNKGFLVWDIYGKDKHEVYPIHLDGARKFYTIKLNDDLSVPDVVLDQGGRLRVVPPRQLTLVEQKETERKVRKLFSPHDLIVLPAGSITTQTAKVGKKSVGIDNLRQATVQENLLREWLGRHDVPSNIVEMVIDLNRKYQVGFEQQDETARNVSWRLNSIVWSNMFNYGEDNAVDFDNIRGLTGIFAENSKGKSSFIDVIMEALFDKVTKGITKNLNMINDNKEVASIIADVMAEDHSYVIERKIERLKYGARKFDGNEKEWGKTTVDFSVVNDGAKESLNGDLRPSTERQIRQRLGNYDDFMLTSLTSQVNTLDIINCKETDRKKILYKFLDLDIFEAKQALAKEDSKEWYTKLGNLEDSGVREHLERYRARAAELTEEVESAQERVSLLEENLKVLNNQLLTLSSQKVKIEAGADISKIKSQRKDVTSQLKLLADDAQAREAVVKRLESRLSKLPSNIDLEPLREGYERFKEVSAQVGPASAASEKAARALDVHKRKLPLLNEVPCGDEYPGCKFLIDAFVSKNGIPGWQEKLDVLLGREAELQAELDRLEPVSQRYEDGQKATAERQQVESDLGAARLKLENVILKIKAQDEVRKKLDADLARLAQAELDLQKNRDLDEQISQVQSKKQEEERTEKKAREKLNSLLGEVGAQRGIISKLEEELATLEDVKARCTAYEQYIEAMGKDGIAYEILTQKLPLINEEINKILSGAADFNVVIEHDSDEQSIRLYLQYGDYRPRILELGGGAEKMLASIAIRVALLSISNLPKTNMFIVDEGFGKLDPKNMEAVGRMFDYLKTVFEHVIVISHIDSMKDMVDNILEITTDEEGYSHISI